MKRLKLISITLLSLSVTACGDKVSGKYSGKDCIYSMDFKGDGVVYVSAIPGAKMKTTYKIKDNIVVVIVGPFHISLNIDGDTLKGVNGNGKCVLKRTRN